MLVEPLYKLVHMRKGTPDGIVAIYINSALRTFAISLIGVFLPVFLFIEAQKLFGQGIHIGLYGIILYFFIERLVATIMIIPSSKIISKWGFRWSIFSSNILFIILLALLSLADGRFWIFIIASVVQGLQTPLYWLSYRTLFAKEGVLSNIGREVGFSAISTQLASIAGPVLGGVMITVWGFPALFLVALVVTVFSGIPFFFMPRHEHKFTVNWKKVVLWVKEKKHLNEELAFIGRNIDGTIYALVWPIFVYLLLDNFEKQGLIASLGLIASTVMVYIAGRVFDKKHSENIYRLGVIATSLTWIVRGFARTLNHFIFVDTLSGSVSPFYWVTFDSLVYERSRSEGEDVVLFMAGRMLVVSCALFLVLITLFLVAQSPFRFWLMWVLAMAATLSTAFMWEEKSSGH